MSKLDDPRERDIPTNYWNEVYRDYALIEAVREVAIQLKELNGTLVATAPGNRVQP